MPQTENVRKSDTGQKRARPGQRQQERLLRQERRHHRLLVWTATSAALVLISAGMFGIIKYQQHKEQQTNVQATVAANAQATTAAKANATATSVVVATATAVANVTATVNVHAVLTATSGSPVPIAGPMTPPSVSGSPVQLASGLQYIDIRVGTGPIAKEGSTAQVEYTGWLQSTGQKFDSSYDRLAEPIEVTPLGEAQIIAGWNQGLIGMQLGGTRRLIIPPQLAYGEQGKPPAIPPNATLIFDVTLISVK
jgi:peptidylprolyl isomerase